MRTRTVAVGCALALLASGCGSRLSDDQLAAGAGTGAGGPAVTQPGDTTPTGGGAEGPMFGTMAAPCGPAPDGFTPTASETGVTETTIKIGVVSDRAGAVKTPTASIEESMQAFVTWCNDLGGINGRTLELATYDSQLTNTLAAVQAACNDGLLAIVGSGSVFDDLGAEPSVACDLPDVAAYSANAKKSTAPNVWAPLPNPPQNNAVGPARHVAELFPEAVTEAAIVSSSQVPTAWGQAERIIESWGSVGYDFISVQDTGIFQESYAAEAREMKGAGVRFVTMVSETGEGAKLLRDMRAQDFTPDAVIFGAQYYDPVLLSEPGAEGVYVEMNTIPFEEADEVPAMRQYLDAYEATGTGTAPTGLGVQAFSAGLLFATAASNAGADLTRETLVAEIEKIDVWDGGGLHFTTNPGSRERTGCFLMMQVKDGAFERFHPEEPGTFACDDENIAPINDPELDGSAFTW
jgi:ABC-type branched-subunit amino acid transport system substrate-binding protein